MLNRFDNSFKAEFAMLEYLRFIRPKTASWPELFKAANKSRQGNIYTGFNLHDAAVHALSVGAMMVEKRAYGLPNITINEMCRSRHANFKVDRAYCVLPKDHAGLVHVDGWGKTWEHVVK